MKETAKIKCPFCGVILTVKMQEGIENKSVTCPVCKERTSFWRFKEVADGVDKEDTEYPNDDAKTDYGGHKGSGEESTIMGNTPNFTIGQLRIPGTAKIFRLKPGRNVVGREAATSSADVRIPSGSNRMSREHVVIDVRKVQGKGFVHYVSLYKERLNDTFINNERILFEDCMVLRHGDVLKLPDVSLKFEIPDGEGTEY